MKVIPVGAQPQVPVGNSGQEARDRAIAKFMGGNSPVPANQNAVQIEETIVAPAVPQPAQRTAETQQKPDQPPETTQQAPDPKPADETYSSQLAQVARREKAMRAEAERRETAHKTRQAELDAREAALTAKDGQYQNDYVSKQQLKADAFRTLAELGVDVNALAEQMINQPQVDPRVEAQFKRMQSEIERLQKANEEAQTRAQQSTDEQYQAAIRQINNDVKQLVKTEPDQYELIQAHNAFKDVTDLIERVYKEEGQVMDTEEAAREVEAELLERAMKLTKLKKLQPAPKAEPASPAAPANPQAAAGNKTTPQTSTLTNAISSTRQLSARERAIIAFEGKSRS